MVDLQLSAVWVCIAWALATHRHASSEPVLTSLPGRQTADDAEEHDITCLPFILASRLKINTINSMSSGGEGPNFLWLCCFACCDGPGQTLPKVAGRGKKLDNIVEL